MKKYVKKFLPLLFVCIAIIAAAAIGTANAKYVKETKVPDSIVTSKIFRFRSDLLTESGINKELNPGTTALSFNLYNYDGLIVSELEIAYTVTLSAVGETDVVKTGTFSANTKQSATIQFDNLKPGVQYTITATGTGGYSKTLTGIFTIKADPAGVYKNTHVTDEYIDLTIWTKNSSGEVSVTFPAGLVPDYSNPALAGIQNYTSGQYTGTTASLGILEEYSSVSYRFFIDGYAKTADPVRDIVVSVDSAQAVEAEFNNISG